MSKVLSFDSKLNQLKEILTHYSEQASASKLKLVKELSTLKWGHTQALLNYQESLLFMAAHPDNKAIRQLVESEFTRITKYFKRLDEGKLDNYRDTFLPYTSTSLIFSHEFLTWLHQLEDCQLSFDGMDAHEYALNDIFKLTLPSLESEITSIGYSNNELLKQLGIKKNIQLDFLLQEFKRLQALPKAKDYIWDQLKIWSKIKGISPGFSKFFNRLNVKSTFYTDEIIKRFNHSDLFGQALPKPTKMDKPSRQHLRETIGKSMVHTMRETDPSTYMDENSLCYYDLERGISIALYGIKAGRQMPIQSYIGYTLFKNGYPAAYGGSWIYGERAHFGINIYEQFRGGESGYVMCQLLRTYIQLFQLKYIEVDAYQFGRDNPDGIKSGAFWFYYRFGFRPIEDDLAELAEKEVLKIKQKPGYRTGEKTLIKLAEQNIALNLGNVHYPELAFLSEQVKKYMIKKHGGNRNEALHEAVTAFKIACKQSFTEDELFALEDFALLYKTFETKLKKEQDLISQLVRLKTTDFMQYNFHLHQLLLKIKA